MPCRAARPDAAASSLTAWSSPSTVQVNEDTRTCDPRRFTVQSPLVVLCGWVTCWPRRHRTVWDVWCRWYVQMHERNTRSVVVVLLATGSTGALLRSVSPGSERL